MPVFAISMTLHNGGRCINLAPSFLDIVAHDGIKNEQKKGKEEMTDVVKVTFLHGTQR